ncbi:tetratricopeptide repeat protein [Flavilitoribacter nigricans]|uniref:Tetratricopeptide repeat protein n=1 Tax=Flavilitoribacter nigricans (strain ATCC 23147 / DSM 23189 / NBRC 102662 / NCIMB 1420 / SS-2) TaxID=1122177 RepID=A0A2D0NIL9_FLAN2|nr:hypothetical protein [Flavilitoribacter nigricans]PHN08288.1 hypothetical protein CRP01_02910 [Flavilitoribacter nigricans DSM 23189 = NBRC 102662]
MQLLRTQTAFLLLISLICFSCKQEAPDATENHLGEIHFQPSGKDEAQPHFQRGLLLLHSFEYDDAKKAFLEAQAADPDMAMAFWGEAMTYNHPLWRRQKLEDGRAALQKLAETPEARQAKTGSELEADLMAAADILYGEGEKVVRDSAYAGRMEELHRKYPGNHEVAAFYALSLLGAVPVGRDYEVYGQGAQIAKGILEENPNHPGALHYMIHAYDDPEHAAMAIKAANSYSKVAPDAAHALHMPSHIYVAMGMWDEVVSANIASYGASVKRMERLGLDNDARSYHAFSWLMYGHLQKDQLEAAGDILRKMVQYTEELPSVSARSYLISMKGNYLVESGDWKGAFKDIQVDVSDLSIVDQGIQQVVEGMKAFRQQDKEKLEGLIRELEDKRQAASLQISDRGTPLCSAAPTGNYKANQLDIDQVRVMELQLRSLYARLLEKPEMAEQLIAEAADLEATLDYSYGPPVIVMPSFELYGEWLLEQERPEEAIAQFDRSLDRGPRRVRALRGKLLAAKQLSDEKTVNEIKTILEEITNGTDETYL